MRVAANCSKVALSRLQTNKHTIYPPIIYSGVPEVTVSSSSCESLSFGVILKNGDRGPILVRGERIWFTGGVLGGQGAPPIYMYIEDYMQRNFFYPFLFIKTF